MTTINQIKEALKTFTNNHLQLNTYFNGDQFDFQATTNIYPALVSNISTSTIQVGLQVINYDIFIMDLCNKDLSNVDDIHSDTFQILQDLFAYLRDPYPNLNYSFSISDTTISAEPFTEENDDILAGWYAKISFEAPYDASSCNIAM